MNYTLIRSKRKTAAIYIRDSSVEVRAPLRMPKRDIDRFVSSKERWIVENLARQNVQAMRREAFAVDYGTAVRLRGKDYAVLERDGGRFGFDGEAFYMPSGLSREQIKAACVQIYRRLAKTHLPRRAAHFARHMGVIPSAVKITGAKTRWGSCSSRKSLNFSWRLIMAEDSVIDYVVVHELAHLREMNHSARFWAIVAGIMPDYQERRTKLKALQKRLASEDWQV